MNDEPNGLKAELSALKMQIAALRTAYLADHGVVEDPALAYAIVRGIYPVLHDGPHADFASQFSVSREEMTAIRSGLLNGSITSSMEVERMIDHSCAPNFKIVAGFILRYFFLSGFDLNGREWADIGLTGDAAFAFKPFQASEISVA